MKWFHQKEEDSWTRTHADVGKLRAYAQLRIDAGDPDFDNWIYRLRDKSDALLRLLEEMADDGIIDVAEENRITEVKKDV